MWSYDFAHERTHDGRPLRLLNIINEYTRAALMIRVERKLNSVSVIELWRRHYNEIRPHDALGWRPPAPEAVIPLDRQVTIQ